MILTTPHKFILYCFFMHGFLSMVSATWDFHQRKKNLTWGIQWVVPIVLLYNVTEIRLSSGRVVHNWGHMTSSFVLKLKIGRYQIFSSANRFNQSLRVIISNCFQLIVFHFFDSNHKSCAKQLSWNHHSNSKLDRLFLK